MAETMTPVREDWNRFDVPEIWAMIAPEREGTNREQVNAWLRTSEMLASHQTNLQTIRDRLAERWPPTGSGAARQLLARIDAFILSARASSEVTRSNASALSLLTDALADAQSRIEPIYRAWQSSAPRQRVELAQQARAVMAQTDAIVAEHGGQFIAPDEDWWIPREGGGQDSGTAPPQRIKSLSRPSIIPPLSKAPGETNSTLRQSGQSGNAAIGDPTLPQLRLSNTVSETPTTQDLEYAALRSPTGLPMEGVLELEPDLLSPIPSPTRPLKELVTNDKKFGGMPSETPIDQVIRGGRSDPSRGELGKSPAEGGRTTQEPLGGGLLGGVGAARQARVASRPTYPREEEWAVSEGVSPILKLTPPRAPTFDPGPNVIGFCT